MQFVQADGIVQVRTRVLAVALGLSALMFAVGLESAVMIAVAALSA
jgi:hypothetical protein